MANIAYYTGPLSKVQLDGYLKTAYSDGTTYTTEVTTGTSGTSSGDFYTWKLTGATTYGVVPLFTGMLDMSESKEEAKSIVGRNILNFFKTLKTNGPKMDIS